MLPNCCVALAHMFDATQLMGWVGGWRWWRSWHVHTCEMLRNCCVALAHMFDGDVPGMCRHVRCYATVVLFLHTSSMLLNWWGGVGTFLACAHMWDATQLLCCSCTHVRCYLTDGVGMMTFLACAHMWDATQQEARFGKCLACIGFASPDKNPGLISPPECFQKPFVEGSRRHTDQVRTRKDGIAKNLQKCQNHGNHHCFLIYHHVDCETQSFQIITTMLTNWST